MNKRQGILPTYAICICNYNMGDTLSQSLSSIMNQINEQYEVILVDDGSTDKSLEICRKFKSNFSNFDFLQLPRDSNRKLGETRNISIRKARAEWCIFHLDCDDLIGPYIDEFAKLVTTLDKALPHDVLFTGQQIHMAKRDFLLSKGPFSNIYRGEDRDLYHRLVKDSEWIVISHKRFISRIDRSKSKQIKKSIGDALDQMETDLRSGVKPLRYIIESVKKSRTFGIKLILIRVLAVFWIAKSSRNRGLLERRDYPSHEEFLKYRSSVTKSASEWLSLFQILEKHEINRTIFY